ncbi:MAG: hypothetical protein ACHQJ6_04430, partial [Candidatus Berkiellales bacterium]
TDDNFKVLNSFKTNELDLNDDFDKELKDFFDKIEKYLPINKINHKTVSASPVWRPGSLKQPSRLSSEIKKRLVQFARGNRIKLDQIKSNLKGEQLKNLTKAISSLNVFDGNELHAWEKHTFFTSLHAMKSNTERLIKKLYYCKTGKYSRKKDDKEEFGKWRKSL